MIQQKQQKTTRIVNGVLLLDKPKGITSNAALQRVKRIYQAKKAGHTGALDPLATGLLPICLGEATKFSQFLLDADKTYEVCAKLGIRTTTSDADGDIINEKPVQICQDDIEAKLHAFRGQIEQIPSMFSALKHQGKPLYEYARAGQDVPRKARTIKIYTLILRHFCSQTANLHLVVRCSKGTYIRTLVDDLGESLGCGAHVTMLRRTGVADYPTEKMLTLEQLEALNTQPIQLDKHLLTMDTAVQHLPEINISAQQAQYLLKGQAVIPTSSIPLEAHIVKLTTSCPSLPYFIGVGNLHADGKVTAKRMIKTN